MTRELIHTDEQVDDLGINGLRIIQKKNGFRFGVDAVLLSDFAKDAPSEMTMDLCTGTGIVSLLLSAKTKTPGIFGVEIQREVADMAKRSAVLNNLTDRVHFIEADLKDVSKITGKSRFDKVVCNPPYMRANSAIVNESDTKTVSRHEILCTLDDVVNAASQLLVSRGRFFMVHRPQRLADIICTMRKYRIEPKRLRLVAPSPGKEPNLLLTEGMLDGGRELRVLPQLFIYDENGKYTDETLKIYGMR